MTLDEVLLAIARSVLGDLPDDHEALALIILLHTHRLEFTESVSDRPGVDQLSALTQRYACDVVARAWPGAWKRDRANYAHWYRQFNTATPYEVMEDVGPPWTARVARVRTQVLQTGLVRDAVWKD